MKKIVADIQKNIYFILIVLILVFGSLARVYLYGDLNLSIAGNDTQSFVDSSHVPLFSKEILSGRRLLTTNLLYKIFEPQGGYKILANGSIETTRRVLQPGFNNLVITQSLISIIGWGFLAYVISQRLKNPILKVLSTGLMLVFAFTPQVADWDSILMSESLNFSLFALQLALLIKFSFLFYESPTTPNKHWLFGWMVTYFLWSFVRPTNLIVALVTFAMLALVVMITKKYRQHWQIYTGMIFVISIFFLSLITTSNSTRSLNYDVYHSDILASPTRVAIFQSWGMPDPNSPEYPAWFEEHSSKTLLRFMITHPGYPVTKIIRDFPEAFKANKQTYFKAPEQNPAREILMTVGDMVHTPSYAIFLMNVLLLFGITYSALINNSERKPWAWVGIWLFLTASILIVTAILGDSWGLIRHALHATTIYRLCMWLFAIIIIDIALEKNSQPTQITQ